MVNELNRAVSGKGIQLVPISRPSAYGEYEPYEMLDDIDVFKERVKNLRNMTQRV